MPTAVVVGAQGVIGRYLVERFAAQPGWNVIGLSRRRATDAGNVRHISVDLQNADEAVAKLGGLRDATHILFAAFQPGSGAAADFAKNITANRDMLVNSVSAIEAAAPELERVVLVTGTKYYGSHLGPFRTPAREEDPRHLGPNYYFDQIDWLTGFQRGKRWSWAELRPQTLCGFAPGTAMSIVPVIAVYAAISKELGLPLCFPGTPENYRAVYQCTGAEQLAKAIAWMSTEPRCANQAFNITNGDYIRWCNLWPKFAAYFDMPLGPVRTVRLADVMADKAPVWQRIVEKYDLRPVPFESVALWPYGDFLFTPHWDVMSSTTKARQYGFADLVDTEALFIELLDHYRKERVLP